jgi:tRNA-dihydrouridine synthase B
MKLRGGWGFKVREMDYAKGQILEIGNIILSSKCILAPLAGISDLPFRLINRSLGCEFAFTEMINARALVYQNKVTLGKMLASLPADRPLGVQLLGSDPEVLGKALDVLPEDAFDLIDFNAACPVPKVTGRGEGASLLKEPQKLRDLLRVIVKNVSLPVTVKIRHGWDHASINAREVARYAEDAGIQGLFIHGRTRDQGYSGNVDYQVIREVKEAITIPVIASGDALSPQLIKKMFDETGCDGVAIARGALGNPWIFRETSEFLKTGTIYQKPEMDELVDTMLSHLNLTINFHGESMGTKIFRKFFNWYTKGLAGIRPLRWRAFQATTKNQMIEIIKEVGFTDRDGGFLYQ